MNKKLEISFYHLTTTPLLNAFPKILDKIVSSGLKSVVLFADEEKMEEMNKYLWSFSTKTIIPHGSCNDEFPEEQPVYLTVSDENPNNATVLVMTQDTEHADYSNFDRCLYMFDGNIENDLIKARNKWKKYNDKNHALTYWKQSDKGVWEKKII